LAPQAARSAAPLELAASQSRVAEAAAAVSPALVAEMVARPGALPAWLAMAAQVAALAAAAL